MATYTKEETRKIATQAFQLVRTQNWNAGLPIRFDSWRVDDNQDMPTAIIVTKTASYQYTFYVRYNPGSDEYDTRFGKMLISNTTKSMLRADWYVQMVTEWVCGLPIENIFMSLQSDFHDKNKLDYHNLADEIKDREIAKELNARNAEIKAVMETPETDDYEAMLRFAGWIS